MKKPNWVCSTCSMWSSRKSSVKRHIQNIHRGNSNLVPFIDYLVGRESGLYFPNPRPTYEKGISTTNTTVTVLDTFKGEVWKAVATKAANKVLYPASSPAVNQQQYLSNFQGFGNFGAPYFYPSQFRLEPSYTIPRPEDIFGFEIYTCKKCSNIQAVIVFFNDGKEGGSRINWSSCCDFGSFSDLKKLDQKNLNDNNELQQKVQAKLKYCVKIWTNIKPMLTAIKIPESFHGNSIILIPAGKQKCVSVECLREKTIELKTDNYNQDHCVTRCIKDGKISFGNEQELSVFLNRVKIATYGFFKVNNSKLYLLAIVNPNIEYHANNGRIELFS